MSMGGNFYALSDALLTRMVCASDGEPNDKGVVEDFYNDCFMPFLDGGIPNEPREVFSDYEWHWYALTVLLDEEGVCGVDEFNGDSIGYSRSSTVKTIASRLSTLTDDEIHQRYIRHADEIDNPPLDEILELIHNLTAFYQRAAANGHAVVFRVT